MTDDSPSRPRRRWTHGPRVLLTAVSAVVLTLMIYINIHAMRHNVGSDVSHSNFLRMLERSIDYSSSTGGSGGSAGAAGGGSEGDLDLDSIVDSSIADLVKKSDDDKEQEDLWRVGKLQEMADRINGMGSTLEGRLQLLLDRKQRAEGVSSQNSNNINNNNDNSNNNINNINVKKGMGERERSDTTTTTKMTHEELKSFADKYRRIPQPEKNLTGMNILLLYADDWTHHTLSSFHKTEPLNTVLKTPVLDALASDGMRFTHNCVTTSVCWISRATLYTGQYLSRHNTKEPCCWGGRPKPKKRMDEMPADWKELSVYEILAENGYHVGHAGKWGVYLPFPKNVDFNVEEDGWHYRKLGDKTWHITEKNEADALRFLATRPRDKPFFLNVAFYATHAKDSDKRQYMPQQASMDLYTDVDVPVPPTGTEEAWNKMPYFFDERNEGRTRWHSRFDGNGTKHQVMMKNYYRMATEVDAACGIILEELRRQDALDNTFILFTTDNGNFHSEHGLADKWYPHQESIRVPLIIHDPRMKNEKKGTTNDDFTLNIDLPPTLLGAAGIPAPEKMMGRDMSPLYLEQQQTPLPEWRDEFFYEHPIISRKTYIPASEALVRKDFKYMYWPDWNYEQLFDLVNDPGEMEDIFNSTKPEIVEIKMAMKKRFAELKKLVKSDELVT
eukprot:CAMPEP_0181100994 /NCGR_PEP_ID=MMETSP1071-20121207/13504_1 /TAXON_ID=35127 /ORGANISM="Thalassiosira sp., Strain NH16" /LENGTH=670 /DNA_ID=CAMNT_0023183789 /DNA_START=229 /DNA_END=2237 /DNA_ORIENTATION=-